jgi:hypothetical protein
MEFYITKRFLNFAAWKDEFESIFPSHGYVQQGNVWYDRNARGSYNVVSREGQYINLEHPLLLNKEAA